MKTIVIVTNIPTPYRIPLFCQISEDFDKLGYHLVVIFAALGYERRKWTINEDEMKFDYAVLAAGRLNFIKAESPVFTYPNLYKTLRKYKPEIVIITGYSPATIKLWFLRLVGKVKYIIWSGAIVNVNRPVSLLRKIQRNLLIRFSSACIAYGSKAKEYLIANGAIKEKVAIAINTVDTTFYLNYKKNETVGPKSKVSTLLYVGNLTKGKCIDRVISCLDKLLLRIPNLVFQIVGDGPEKENLMSLTKQLKVNSQVDFIGFVQKDEVVKYMAQADCFVFPSEYDVWGLVLIEAMATGLPCVASIKSGATSDLVKDNYNGYAIDFEDEAVLIESITKILLDTDLAMSMRNNARDFIRNKVSIKKSSEGFVNAVKYSLNKKA